MTRAWQCANGHTWQTDQPPAPCPVCGGPALPSGAERNAATDRITAQADSLVRAGAGRPRPPAPEELTSGPGVEVTDEALPRSAPVPAGMSAAWDETLLRPRQPPPTCLPERPDTPPAGAAGGQEPPPTVVGEDTRHWPGESAPGAPASGGPAGAEVGGYEVLGVLGRGGMGVVYKARQKGLDRIVALKMILAGAHASPEDRARFLREARAVAHLSHPHIVQVHEIGERDGHPFFSLEYLDRGSLAQKLDGTPLEPRAAARLVATLAGAVHYAHERGIVHRDIKPANVLLTADGTPKLTDFGLAKLLLQDDGGQTRSEAVLGTPTYMAPEQASGKTRDVGPAADVYALGAVLYDLLTGRPPFRGTTLLDTLQQVQTAEPVPPARLQPGVPGDLETVCLKCLEKDPARRYQSAKDLADDLRRFLDGRPVLARPVPAWVRAWKWARRRPAVAGLLALAFITPLALLGVALAFTARLSASRDALAEEKRQLNEANDKLARSNSQLQEAQADLSAALAQARRQRARAEDRERDAQDSFLQAEKAAERLIHLAQERLRNEPRMERARQQLLRDALDMCKYFLTRAGDSHAVVWRAARAHRLAGDLHEHLGEARPAAEHYRQAIALYGTLVEGAKDPGRKADYRAERAGAYMNLWRVLEGVDPGEAGRVLESALRELEHPPDDPARRAPYRRDRSALLNNRGIRAHQAGDLRRAEEDYRAAEALLAGLTDRDDCRLELARTRVNLAALWTSLPTPAGKPGDHHARARKAYSRAIDDLEKLVARHPGDPAYARELGRAYANLGVLLAQSGDPARAEEAGQRVEARFRALSAEHPHVPDYRHQLAVSRAALGQLYLRGGEPAKAERQFGAARPLLEELAGGFPDSPAYRHDLARVRGGLGIAALQAGRPEEAEEHFDKARQLLEALAARKAGGGAYADDLLLACHNLVVLHDAQVRRLGEAGDWKGAEAHLARLLRLRRDLAARADVLPARAGTAGRLAAALGRLLARGELAATLLTHARVLLRLGDHRAAARDLDELAPMVSTRWAQYPQVALLLGRCMRLAGRDPDLTPEERRARAREYGRALLGVLRRAAQRGCPALAAKLGSEDFAPLRADEEFREEFRRLADALRRRGGE